MIASYVACIVVVAVTVGCARVTTHVIPMRDIPRAQQERDHKECERQAGDLDVSKPVSGALTSQVVGTAAGAVLGAVIAPVALGTSSDPKEVALVLLGGAGVGGALGFLAGTVVGWRSGLERARDDYIDAYRACMRERGYTVIRDRT